MLPPSDLRVVSKHYDMTAALEPQIAFLLSSNSQYTHTKGMDRFANKNKHTKTFVEVKAIWSPFVTLNNFIMAVRKKKGRLLDWSQGVTNLVVKSDQVYRLSFYGAVSRSLRSEATRSLSTVTATFTGGIPHQSVGSCHTLLELLKSVRPLQMPSFWTLTAPVAYVINEGSTAATIVAGSCR